MVLKIDYIKITVSSITFLMFRMWIYESSGLSADVSGAALLEGLFSRLPF